MSWLRRRKRTLLPAFAGTCALEAWHPANNDFLLLSQFSVTGASAAFDERGSPV